MSYNKPVKIKADHAPEKEDVKKEYLSLLQNSSYVCSLFSVEIKTGKISIYETQFKPLKKEKNGKRKG